MKTHIIAATAVLAALTLTACSSKPTVHHKAAPADVASPSATPVETTSPIPSASPTTTTAAAQPSAPVTVTSYRITATSADGIALVLADDTKYKTRTPLKGIGGTMWQDVPATATGVSVQVISQTGDGVSCTITAKETGKVVASQSLAPAHGQGAQSIECDMP